ncbi:hypothetical protein EVAR_89038_1 [Eumeta japonica]|uniref:Uncharacterized protein n=1 Tax=Eumeta variegata TaxID=151549 RepID=A0A4C1Z313_EUMVA|nr:hypothetical protein EVAR_89038_1 [Eumeta japonica]
MKISTELRLQTLSAVACEASGLRTQSRERGFRLGMIYQFEFEEQIQVRERKELLGTPAQAHGPRYPLNLSISAPPPLAPSQHDAADGGRRRRVNSIYFVRSVSFNLKLLEKGSDEWRRCNRKAINQNNSACGQNSRACKRGGACECVFVT